MLGNECEVPNARILGQLSMGIEYQQLAVTATDWKSVFWKWKETSEWGNQVDTYVFTYGKFSSVTKGKHMWPTSQLICERQVLEHFWIFGGNSKITKKRRLSHGYWRVTVSRIEHKGDFTLESTLLLIKGVVLLEIVHITERIRGRANNGTTTAVLQPRTETIAINHDRTTFTNRDMFFCLIDSVQ